MKEKRLLEAIGKIDEKYIAEAAERRQKKRTLFRAGGIAAALILVFAGIGTAAYYRALYPYPIEYIESTSEVKSSAEVYQIPRWEEMSDPERYYEVKAMGNSYLSNSHAVTAEQIDTLLTEAILTGYDEYEDKVHAIGATVYSVEGFSEECVTAVQFDGSAEYYLYLNHLYKPETLGQFIADLNLKETLMTGTVYYDYRKINGDYASVRFEDLETQKVWELLMDDLTLENVADYDQMWLHRIMGISIDIPALGYENISLEVTEEGYLTTNILATGKAFYIGEEKVDAFVNYVLKNCSGKEVVHRVVDSEPERETGSELERP